MNISLEETLNETCLNLTSVRATERKKSAETLKDYLSKNALPTLLTQNTLIKSGYNWNNVFDDINDYILKETEKFETSKTFHHTTVPLCSSLLLLCVAGSNKDRAYIKCEKITKACLFVLNDSRLTEAIGDAYISLLYKYVLPCEYYLSYITPPIWENLLEVCITSCSRQRSNLDDLLKTRLLWLVVQNACNYSQFAIPLRDSLSRLKKCCVRALNNKKIQEFALKIVILILETLSTESRLTVCEFSESILPPIFKIYEQSMEQTKKSLLFKLCEIAIKIHNPLGRLQSSNESRAHNWDTWNKNVNSMLEIVCHEVSYMQKIKKQNEGSMQCDYFCYVGASAFFQAFSISENIENITEAGNSAKKVRITFNTRKSFTELIEELRINCASWTGIMQMFVKHFKNSISYSDYISLIRVLEDIIQDSQKKINWEKFEDLSCMVINNLLSLDIQNSSDILGPLWNTCVRNAAVSGNAQKAVHSIMLIILNSVPLKYDTVKPLSLLYIEKGIPVNNHTVATLNSLYHKFYRKTCYLEIREKYFAWLINGNIINLVLECVKELLLRLLSNDNIGIICQDCSEGENVYDIIFKCIDKSILYSDFEYRLNEQVSSPETVQVTEHFEMNTEMNSVIEIYLEQILSLRDENKLIEYCKYINIVITYINLLLKYKLKTDNEVASTSVYMKLKSGLRHMFTALTQCLTSDIQIYNKVAVLKSVQDILMQDYGTLLNKEIRSYIDEDCFHCIYNIIKCDVSNDDGETGYEEIEYTPIGLKQNCIYFLAAYCRYRSIYTEDILKCILDHDLYNFSSSWDTVGALRCIQILNESIVEQTPLELSFSLLQDMCKELFRYPKATRGLLLIIKEILTNIWDKNDRILQENCYIMIHSYLQRCERLFYPPDVAALVYECVAKMVKLNNQKNLDLHNSFKDVLQEKIKGSDHKIRLYCCHLLSYIIDDYSNENFQELSELREIFLINVSGNKETVLKDELMNRTAAVLHCFYVIGVSNSVSIHQIVLKIIEFQSEKNMDKVLVKKVADILTKTVSNNSIEVYMHSNIIRVLQYWFHNNKPFELLPLFLFGFNNIDDLLEKHLKWLVSTDILWRNKGSMENSEVLKYVRNKTSQSLENTIEICFCNIIALSLPYIVMEKYKIETGKPHDLLAAGEANKMFQSTRQILKDEKWSNLFVENLGELVLLTARRISDHDDASVLFRVQLIKDTNSYTYSKKVFSGILKYFGELIDGNIMQYLCENQPLLLFNILFKLWEKVLREKIYTYKVLDFHAYLTFIDNIPFGYSSDAILTTFACANIANALKKSQSKEDMKIFVEGLKIVTTKILSQCHSYRNKFKTLMLPKVISIINFKIAEGYTECDSVLRYLSEDMKDNFVEDEDVVDFINVMSQYETKSYAVASKLQFRDKLKTYASSLSHASHETLAKLRKFVKHNNIFLKDLYMESSEKGFSEDCKTSVVHQIISLLSNLMKTTSDDKVIIEACNCLAEIGSYDIKTLVTVPPINTARVVDLSPTQYIAESALSSLSEHLFDKDPAVSNTIAKAISKLLKFNDGHSALDAVESDRDILVSLLCVNCESYAKYKIDNKKFDLYNSIDYWVPTKDESHSHWLTRITLALLDLLSSSTNYLSSLSAVCAIKTSICRKILPALMGLILYSSTDIHSAVIGEQINQVFKYIWELSFDDDLENSDVAGTPKTSKKINHDLKMIINYLLDIVDFVRIQRGHYRSRTRGRRLETLNYLNLDYNKVSWAATIAEQHLSAIFYGEVGAAAVGSGEHGERILRRCYVSIGEMDAIDGCGTAHLTIDHEKRKHLINTGQYADALLLCDIALSRGNEDDNVLYGAVTSLHRSGMHHLALQYIKSYPQNDKLDDIKYDCLSYLGDWSDFVDTVELEDKSRIGSFKQDSIIKAMRYSCLKDCLNIKPTVDFDLKFEKPLIRAKLATARLCQSLNMENSQSVYKLVGYLHLFRDIERYFSVRCGKMSLPDLMEEWKVDNLPVFNDFKHLEALISQRSLILEHAAGNHSMHLPEVTDLQLEYAELGLSNQRIQMAQRLVASVKNDQSSKKVALIESQITWAKGHKDIALSLLKGLITQDSQDLNLTAMSLRQYGLWMSESKRENARDIIHKYLEKSLEALNRNDDNETRYKVYYDIATFADAEYKQVVSYMNSSVFENKVKCVENMKGTAASLKSSQQKLTKDERKALITNNAFRVLDEAEIVNTKGEKESFLRMAMKYYLLSLRNCDENNLSVFRVISLWFDNPGFNFEEENLVRDLEAVPSWKFITVLPQLAPRLSNENTPFANHLKKIIKRCALEHPHHTLPILFNLKNSDKDSTILNASGSVSLARPGEARVLAAATLIQELADTQLAVPISQMELICDATIRFAYYKPTSKETKNYIPKAEPILHLKNLNAIPIPTDTIDIRKDCDYSRINTLSSFNNYFELVGGITLPKKISCTRSDGKNRIMLIKGEDDLRQDAVMQQVFNIVNTLLEQNPITNRNKLLIRTYKVAAMSRRSGALEWCAGTQPLGAYLLDAHVRYRPTDITPSAARTKLKDCHENGRSVRHKLEAFNGILRDFHPVFHYFFTEHYLDPVTWYERRLAYTRSVATSSMVGYILGLGDRHVQNILIDKTTAEVIHIDFGIAFDQGKTLPTPETVPFRLTQDIVAGFGSSGVEGIFRRCCERTLQLLRDHQEILLTILEVLLCDPLYLWIVSTNSKAKTSNSRSPSSSALASRALLLVRSKLSGAGGAGGAGGVSVAGLVARLLVEASDPANLCRLFPGWQPYL